MIKAIQEFFNKSLAGDVDRDDSEHSLRLAAAVLLFEVARADYSLDEAECGVIRDVIETQFDLDKSEVDELLSLAEVEAHEATGLHEFTALINQYWSIEERSRLIERMWKVVYADGRLDDHEQHLMRKMQGLLHVPHLDYVGAKLRQQKLVTSGEDK